VTTTPPNILTDALRQAVRRPEVIDALCSSLEAQLREQLGGADVYVGKRPSRHDRDARIRELFNGSNYDHIAKVEGISARQVRRILGRDRPKK